MENLGVKYDDGKPRYSLLSNASLEGLAQVLTYGAGKYGDNNWRAGLHWSRVFSACMRHLWAWWSGEDTDAETGFSHLDHAAACVHFLSHYTKKKVGTDDRPN